MVVLVVVVVAVVVVVFRVVLPLVVKQVYIFRGDDRQLRVTSGGTQTHARPPG